MEKLIICVAGVIVTVAAMLICRIPTGAPNEDGKSSGMDIKVLVAFILCCIDIRAAAPDGFGEIFIAAVVTLIVFVLLFYLIYGVMSLLKISGDNVGDRRIKAFWVNAAISTALNLLVYA